MQDKNNIVIIGSGLGGLACGVILATHGYRVTILEQQAVPGGCLQCFTRKGTKFETGMHYIGSAHGDQLLGRLMKYLGVYDSLRLLELDREAYDIIKVGDTEYRMPNGYDNITAYLGGLFPAEKENLARFFKLVKDVANASSVHRLSMDEGDLVTTMKYQMVSINEVVDSYIQDPMLRQVIVGNLPLYGGMRDRTPFSTYAFITDFYNNSAYRFADGSDALSDALIARLRAHGGEVVYNAPVTAIECDETHALHALTADGRVFPGDIFISSAHPARTLEMLSGTRLLRPAYRRRIMELPDSPGAFSVYLKFKPGTVPYSRSNYFEYPGGNVWDCEQYTAADWPRGYLYMHFNRDEATDTALTGVVLSYMNYDEVKQWHGTRPMKRGREYEEFKRRRATRLLEELERSHPGLCDCIEEYYTSTPLTYRDYTGVEGGSMYGIAKDITLGAAGRITTATRIPNVLLTGQNVNSHGILGVIVGALLTCSELIPLDSIFAEIRKH